MIQPDETQEVIRHDEKVFKGISLDVLINNYGKKWYRRADRRELQVSLWHTTQKQAINA